MLFSAFVLKLWDVDIKCDTLSGFTLVHTTTILMKNNKIYCENSVSVKGSLDVDLESVSDYVKCVMERRIVLTGQMKHSHSAEYTGEIVN